jgi:hypothetical protein
MAFSILRDFKKGHNNFFAWLAGNSTLTEAQRFLPMSMHFHNAQVGNRIKMMLNRLFPLHLPSPEQRPEALSLGAQYSLCLPNF